MEPDADLFARVWVCSRLSVFVLLVFHVCGSVCFQFVLPLCYIFFGFNERIPLSCVWLVMLMLALKVVTVRPLHNPHQKTGKRCNKFWRYVIYVRVRVHVLVSTVSPVEHTPTLLRLHQATVGRSVSGSVSRGVSLTGDASGRRWRRLTAGRATVIVLLVFVAVGFVAVARWWGRCRGRGAVGHEQIHDFRLRQQPVADETLGRVDCQNRVRVLVGWEC